MTSPYFADGICTLLLGDALHVLRTLPDASADCIVTSPPYYGLRDYGIPGQYGLEDSPSAYVETMRAVFAEARRVLARDGTAWINLGDTYNNRTRGAWRGSSDGVTGRSDSPRWQRQRSIPEKSLLGMPWRVAFALQDDGWTLRNAIVWHKPNAMPESVTDRLATRYEQVFLFTRSTRYYFDLDAIREPAARATRGKSWSQRRTAGAPKRHGLAGPAAAKDNDFAANHAGRNPGDVWDGPARHPQTDYRADRDHEAVNAAGRNPGDLWSINTRPNPEAHFATFPIDLPIRAIAAGCKPGGTVLDPFSGSGTTGAAARLLGCRYLGIDLNPAYHDLAIRRYAQGVLGPAA
jgi:DNA modification methylase